MENKENDYRIKEKNGEFTIEIYSYSKKPPIKNFWGKVKEEGKKVWGWYRADMKGCKLSVKFNIDGYLSGLEVCPPPFNIPPCKIFKSLKAAESQIKEWEESKVKADNGDDNGIRYHYI